MPKAAPVKRVRKELTPASIAAEKKRMSERGGGGASRRGLFFRAPSKGGRPLPFEQVMRFLPANEERGPDGAIRPFFSIAQHWIQKENDDGEKYGAGVTCVDFMREEQPTAWNRYKKEKVAAALEEEQCIFCEILSTMVDGEGDEKEYHHAIPMGGYEKPEWDRRYAHNFAILLPKDDYDDEVETYVKIYPAPISVKDSIYDYLEKKQFQLMFDPKKGWDMEVSREQKGRGPWKYAVTPSEQCPIWYPDWESELPDLEAVSPNWMTREEIVDWLAEEHQEVLDAFGRPTARRRTGMAAKKGSPAKGKVSAKPSGRGSSAAKKAAPVKGKATKATASTRGRKKKSDEEDED